MWDLLKTLQLPISFKRQYAQPLDYDAVFETLADMQTYLSNPVRYQGQIATCLETNKIYHLNAARDAWIDGLSAISASQVAIPAAGNISSTNVKDAIYELDSEKLSTTNTSFIVLQRNITTQTLAFNNGVVYTDASLGHNCELTVTGNFTLQNPTNLTAGTFIYYRFINNANATQKTLTLSSYYKTSGAITLTNALSGTANAVDLVVFKVVSSTRLELYNILNDLR